jgi:tetratricopeptide (TPR) repeat protein
LVLFTFYPDRREVVEDVAVRLSPALIAREKPSRAPHGFFRGLGNALLLCLALSFLVAAPAPALTPEQNAALADLQTLGGFAVLEENHQALLEVARRGLALEPDNPQMIQYMLRGYRGLGQGEQALQFLRGLWTRDAKRYANLRFEAGYIRVEAKEYGKALIHFRHAEEVDKTRAIQEQINVYLAMDDLDKAQAASQRLDKGTATAWLMAGQVLLLKKDFEAARRAFNSGLAANPQPEQAKVLASRLEVLGQAERAARPWRLSATLMAQYEDNVFRDPLQSNPSQAPTRKKGDLSWLTRVDLDYNLGRTEFTSWGLTSQVISLQYLQLRDANYAAMAVGAYWEYQTPKWGFRLPYEFGYYLAKAALLGKAQVNSLLPSLRLQHSENWRTDIEGQVQFKKYLDSDPNIFAWRLGPVHYLSTDATLRRHLRLSYAVSQDKAVDDMSGFVTGEVSLGGATPLWGPMSIDLSLSYVRYFYNSRVDPYLPNNSEVTRKDDQYRALAQVFYRAGERCLLALGYSHTLNDSDLVGADGYDPYDFKRNSVFLLMNWSF